MSKKTLCCFFFQKDQNGSNLFKPAVHLNPEVLRNIKLYANYQCLSSYDFLHKDSKINKPTQRNLAMLCHATELVVFKIHPDHHLRHHKLPLLRWLYAWFCGLRPRKWCGVMIMNAGNNGARVCQPHHPSVVSIKLTIPSAVMWSYNWKSFRPPSSLANHNHTPQRYLNPPQIRR